MQGCGTDEWAPDIGTFPGQPIAVTRAGLWGVSVPPSLAGAAAAGVVLMVLPGLLDFGQGLYAGVYFSGVFAVVVSVCSLAEVARAGRYLNLLPALWLLAAPFVLGRGDVTPMILIPLLGVALAALSLPRGVVRERYGEWDRLIC